jgi:probable HAF family extracellular repeat protein
MLARGVLMMAIWFSGALVARSAEYRITDLGSLGNGFEYYSRGLSDLGAAVGWLDLNIGPNQHQAFLSDGGAMSYLTPPGSYQSEAVAISEGGLVVGWRSTFGVPIQVFTWQKAAGYQDVLLPIELFPTAINDAGQFTGYGDSRAFFYTPGVGLQEIGAEFGDNNAAFGINHQGHAVGTVTRVGVSSNAFLFRDDQITILDPNNIGGVAYDVNDQDQVVGTSDGRAFFWNEGVGLLDLGTLGGAGSIAYSLNEHGTAVGSANIAGPLIVDHAFIWNSEFGMRDLNSLIPPGSGWDLRIANGINNSGQIVGWGLRDTQVRGFLLTPVPEPAAMGLALAGLGVLAIFARRCR